MALNLNKQPALKKIMSNCFLLTSSLSFFSVIVHCKTNEDTEKTILPCKEAYTCKVEI